MDIVTRLSSKGQKYYCVICLWWLVLFIFGIIDKHGAILDPYESYQKIDIAQSRS